MFPRSTIISLLALAFETVHGKYECYMSGKNFSCTNVEQTTLYKNITVTLSNEDTNAVEELVVTNSSIATIEEGTFINFKNLRRLHLTNTSTLYLEELAFANLLNLQILSISDNYLRELNSNVFEVNNSLTTLDVSHNLISDLSSFDIDSFPSLIILNVSHNTLEYLPASILDKLEEVNNFYLIVDNNPWNCSHSGWSQRLTERFVAAFCTGNVYESREAEYKMRVLENLSQNGTGDASQCFWRCAFLSCVWWILGAVWLGVILGNVCKLKRLLFTQPRTYVDKNTQCDKLDLLPKA